MAPIRTAIIGLSSAAATSWAAGAHLPYLLSLRGQAKYKIVALCNSSVDAAKRAIEAYNLAADTKAYGDPQALADDPDIDLVVCCTRVDLHHQTSLPSVKAGKNVYIEWPLAQDVERAAELVEAAKVGGGKTITGVQGRLAAPIVRVREILEEGRIGKVLSSEVRAAGGTVDRVTVAPALAYFMDRAVGGNVYTIGFAHLIDQVQSVLGEAVDTKAHFQLQRPEAKLKNAETKEIVGTVTSNVPDLFSFNSYLPASAIVQDKASLLVNFRRGQPFPGEPSLNWTISGEKGELRLVSKDSAALQAFAEPVTIEVHDFETDKVESVKWSWEDWQTELPMPSRSVGKVYETFAAGDEGVLATFVDALTRHKQLEEQLSKWSAN